MEEMEEIEDEAKRVAFIDVRTPLTFNVVAAVASQPCKSSVIGVFPKRVTELGEADRIVKIGVEQMRSK